MHPPILTFRNKELSFGTPVVMGILNATPDSFSDGGKYNTVERALQQIEKMVEEGAAIIDIGGESTRPGAGPVDLQTELQRVIPLFEAAIPAFPDTLFSVDTTKFEVARQALHAGAHIINDVSGLKKEPHFARLCAEFGAGYVLMHTQGDPKTMQKNPVYGNVVKEVETFFEKSLLSLRREGVESILIDPGIGFGKTLKHNLELVSALNTFSRFDTPILAGASRKSMVGAILDGRPSDGRLAGTLAVHYHCLVNGASILRVHDVQEAVDTIRVFNALDGLR